MRILAKCDRPWRTSTPGPDDVTGRFVSTSSGLSTSDRPPRAGVDQTHRDPRSRTTAMAVKSGPLAIRQVLRAGGRGGKDATMGESRTVAAARPGGETAWGAAK